MPILARLYLRKMSAYVHVRGDAHVCCVPKYVAGRQVAARQVVRAPFRAIKDFAEPLAHGLQGYARRGSKLAREAQGVLH
eukprot:15445224-Alexandrium_andersonii.AAC.1